MILAEAGNCMSGVTVQQISRSISRGSMPRLAHNPFTASTAITLIPWSLPCRIRRSLMPVRSVIHASLVSTIDSRRALVRTKSGTYPWTAVMAAVVFMDRNGHVFGRGTKGASWSLERLVDAFMQFAFHHLPGEQQHVLHRMLV